MNTKVVETKASTSLDHAVSTHPYSTYAILEWYTTNIIPRARWRYLQILFQFWDMVINNCDDNYTLLFISAIFSRLDRAILYTYWFEISSTSTFAHSFPSLETRVLAYVNPIFMSHRKAKWLKVNLRTSRVKLCLLQFGEYQLPIE